jgi:hypothetical protein
MLGKAEKPSPSGIGLSITSRRTILSMLQDGRTRHALET